MQAPPERAESRGLSNLALRRVMALVNPHLFAEFGNIAGARRPVASIWVDQASRPRALAQALFDELKALPQSRGLSAHIRLVR
jgi:hypothetical protein